MIRADIALGVVYDEDGESHKVGVPVLVCTGAGVIWQGEPTSLGPYGAIAAASSLNALRLVMLDYWPSAAAITDWDVIESVL